MAKDEQTGRGIQSIGIGGRVLQCLVDAAKPLSLRDIANHAGIASAQAHAYLTSYKRVGMIVQDIESGPYHLGPFALKLGLARLQSLPVYHLADELLKDLSRELNVMSVLLLWGPQGPTAVQVVQARDKRSDLNIRLGTLFSVTNTASGRIFGAFLNTPEVAARARRELEHQTSLHHTDVRTLDEYNKLVEHIRSVGFETISGARIPDVDAVSVPIMIRGTFIACLTFIGHSDVMQLDEGRTTALIQDRARHLEIEATALLPQA